MTLPFTAPPIADPFEEALKARGFQKKKDPTATHMLIRQDAIGTYRVMCFECFEQFDLFGTLAPADATGESTIVQKCLEHLANCSGKTKPKDTLVLQNNHTPHLFGLSVHWQP